jgi:cytochrome P450
MTTDTFDPTTFDPAKFNPFAPGFLADPYPVYEWFRKNEPVYKIAVGAKDQAYWIFKDSDARTVLTEAHRFQKLPYHVPADPLSPVSSLGQLPTGIMNANPPRHGDLRRWAEPMLTDGIANAPATSGKVMEGLMAKLSGTRRFELMQDIALPMPSLVLYEVLGFGDSQMADMILTGWITAMVAAHNAMAPAGIQMGGLATSMALITYLQGLMALHIDHDQPIPGVFGAMAESVKNGEMERGDAVAVMDNMTVAGYITTTFLIGTGIRSLLSNPDQLALLRSDPTLIGPAVEEMLRFDAPAQMVSRATTEDLELSGVELPAGTRVNIVLGSANRDSDTYTDPDKFEISREDPTQMAFGGGIHECIGAPLARITTPTAIMALLQLDNLRIDGTAQWQTDPYLRGMTSMPLAYGA